MVLVSVASPTTAVVKVREQPQLQYETVEVIAQVAKKSAVSVPGVGGK